MPLAGNLHTAETVFLFLLVLVALFAALAQRLKIPYPIVLVLAGLGISFVPSVPRIPLDPNLIFLVFLPPLLYASAWNTNLREFRKNLVTIAMLALGLVAFTVWGVAEVADRFITALDWKSGFLLGAVVATTDAIAAASIAKSIGLPQGIVDILEGESLVNDATGLLALEFGLGLLLRNETPTVAGGAIRLLWLLGGGVLVGLLLGVVIAWLERWVDDGPVEMVVSVIAPYAAYLAGEGIRSSGVIAVVTCGLYLSRRSAQFFSPTTRIQILGAWDALNFMLNGLVFVLIGLQLPYVMTGIRNESWPTLLQYGSVFSLVLIVLRLIWMYPASIFASFVRRKLLKQPVERPQGREIFVLGWTGMRGVVALAAAISLPETLGDGRVFAQRNLIVFLTFSVILVTLVVQGLSLPALIRRLGLAKTPGEGPDGEKEERYARRVMLRAAIEHLEAGARGGTSGAAASEAETHAYRELLNRYRYRLEAVQGVGQNLQGAGAALQRGKELQLDALRIERSTLIELRDNETIGDDVLRHLETELDLSEARLTTR
ncbi:Na+/H+ antiporter [Granulicella sp. WH15]|uniref:Na+/H+ antiporter n=1 Tax=Granulicella sp. WH15 TaxID=2602070 RepID=UPI001366F9CD|nr:Na+/H+ antiporter [Granulicella sp. WH15]QHN02028.1 Na+/H+ antiporter [Granulicella sp. WH15]